MLNKEIAEIYLTSQRKKQRIAQLFLARGLGCEKSVSKDVDNWIKQFSRRWKLSHGRERFFEKHKDWLDEPFKPSVATTNQRSVQSSDDLSTPRAGGPKRRIFSDLSESTKNKYSRVLAKKEPLDNLLRSAEKLAHRRSMTNVAKVLNGLRSSGEIYAKKLLKNAGKMKLKASVEASLLLKTRVGLSKRKYEAIEKFSQQMYGVKLLSPWPKIMEHRNKITPTVSRPEKIDGALSIKVALRDMVVSDVSRILEVDEVAERLSALPGTSDETIRCTLHVSAGVDSATGFAHYNQDKILKQDESLLSEHVMPLMLVTEDDEKLWVNPNPQSDTFCHARSMSWAKETDTRTKQIFNAFYCEVDEINKQPIVIESKVNGRPIQVEVSAFYAMVDGKAANAITNNRNTHACPLCVPGADPRVGPALFHSRLNVCEWLIRVSAQKQVAGHPPQASALVAAKAREIANNLEDAFKMSINRPKIGGSGSSNNGNMARRLLDNPEQFSRILGINKTLVEKIRLISCLALSSHKLDPTKVKELYNEVITLCHEEFGFVKRFPPSLHKYSHLPEFIERLPYPLSFIDEQSGERCHKRYKHARLHLARKTSPEDNLTDMMRMSLSWSDPKMSHLEAQSKGRTPKPSTTRDDFSREMEFYYAEQQENPNLTFSTDTDESEDSAESESETSDYDDC